MKSKNAKSRRLVVRSIACSEFSAQELHDAVAGLAAMAEHNARVAENTEMHDENLERVKRYARKIRAAADYIPNVPRDLPRSG